MGTKEGFWQSVDYENVPPYCCHCWHIGHQESQCHVHNPALRTVSKASTVSAKQAQVYRPILQPQHTLDPQPSGLTDSQKTTVPIAAAAPLVPPPLHDTVAPFASLHATIELHDTVAPTVPAAAADVPVAPGQSDRSAVSVAASIASQATSLTVPVAAVVTDSVLVQTSSSTVATSSSVPVPASSVVVDHLPSSVAPPASFASVTTLSSPLPVTSLTIVSKELGFPAQTVAEVPPLRDTTIAPVGPILVAMSEDQLAVAASVTYSNILQGSAGQQQLHLSMPSTSQHTPVPELFTPPSSPMIENIDDMPSSSQMLPDPEFIARPVTPMIENIDGMSSDDDVSQYPFLLPELITDDTSLYRRKLHEDVAKARSDSTKVLIEKPRAELLAEFEEFRARMRSVAFKDFAQHPVPQATLPIDAPEDTLTDINVEDGDYADGFITVKPKNRGRGRPRKHKK